MLGSPHRKPIVSRWNAVNEIRGLADERTSGKLQVRTEVSASAKSAAGRGPKMIFMRGGTGQRWDAAGNCCTSGTLCRKVFGEM